MDYSDYGGVRDIEIFSDSDGERIYVGGDLHAGTKYRGEGVTRWNGFGWEGLSYHGSSGVVYSMTQHPLNGINMLVMVGTVYLTDFDPVPFGWVQLSEIVAFRDRQWQQIPLPPPYPGSDPLARRFTCVESLNFGNGPELFVAERIYVNGIGFCSRVHQWNGAAWNTVGDALCTGTQHKVFYEAGYPSTVRAMCAHRMPDGRRVLVIGGNFNHVGGAVRNGLAIWDGVQWSTFPGLDTGPGSTSDLWVLSLSSTTTNAGSLLAVGGYFSSIAGTPAWSLATHDGTRWHPLDVRGLSPSVQSVRWTRQLDRNVLTIGGSFMSVNNSPSQSIAQFYFCHDEAFADTNADDRVDAIDLTDVLSNFGRELFTDHPADVNADGLIDGRDLSILLAQYGRSRV